ncbi:HTH domain-containing protein [Methylobacterium sp. NEAU 140]|uniref:HTH domain-containing protein n=1 Tax=Methylobacterium sp. NEAU 140 TaxID=3064945 RepID=UPI00273497BC|nr:helix-turn-helix domain-containing protein [Methylobacterium sp. NEAU 140]MDP4026840.1 HTH domain-containing protein [Methylobacterium sp. NEAU 140]
MAPRRASSGAGRQDEAQGRQRASAEPRKPYGYVLILRAIARASIVVGADNPAALRVLCVLAEYVSQDGVCRIGQNTLAARLGVTRQAVNKQIQILESWGTLKSEGTDGATRRYVINTHGLEDARAGDDNVPEWRDRARRERRGEVPFEKRAGYKAYVAALRDGGSPDDAAAAMEAAEAEQGVAYEAVGNSELETWYRRVQPN